jgi:hypothetical protein
MADVKEKITPFDLNEKITVYAPKNAPHHGAGEATQIHPRQKEKFLNLGFTETAPESKEAEAKSKEAKPVK